MTKTEFFRGARERLSYLQGMVDTLKHDLLKKAVDEFRTFLSEFDRKDKSPRPRSRESRTPMHRHRERIIDFLRGKVGATRKEIRQGTGIAEGSLTALLAYGDFEKVSRGRYRLREDVGEVAHGNGRIGEKENEVTS